MRIVAATEGNICSLLYSSLFISSGNQVVALVFPFLLYFCVVIFICLIHMLYFGTTMFSMSSHDILPLVSPIGVYQSGTGSDVAPSFLSQSNLFLSGISTLENLESILGSLMKN
jgi:uncharacterized protein YacL